jgi:predicted dehydrogenase
LERRKFIQQGGLASAALIAGTSAIASGRRKWGANDTINIGVIGTGDRGGGLIPVMNDIQGLHVAACADILPFRLEAALSKTDQKADGYKDYRQILDNRDIDAVLIATPFNLHAKVAMDAMDAGKHIYCEKTLAKGYGGIEELVQRAGSSSKIFQTGHQYHSSRLYAHVVEMIHKGEIGKVSSFECQWNRNGNWRRPVPDPSLERQINWRMYREYSGGLAAELSSHQIDFVNWVLGENPYKIMGIGGIDYWKDGRETFDNIHLLYEYPSGVKATFTCLTSNAQGDYQIKIHGDKGTILLDYTKAWIYYEKGNKKEMGNVDGVSGATVNPMMQGKGTAIQMEHQDPSKQALIDFRDCIMDNRTPLSNIQTGANTAIAVQMSLDAMIMGEIKIWGTL